MSDAGEPIQTMSFWITATSAWIRGSEGTDVPFCCAVMDIAMDFDEVARSVPGNGFSGTGSNDPDGRQNQVRERAASFRRLAQPARCERSGIKQHQRTQACHQSRGKRGEGRRRPDRVFVHVERAIDLDLE